MQKHFLILFLCLLVALTMMVGQTFAGDYLEPPDEMFYDSGAGDESRSVGTDNDGNIYIAVITDSGNGQIVKYTSSGKLKWARDFDPDNPRPASTHVALKSTGLSGIAVDGEGNVYAAGESFNGTDLDCLVKKYNTRGQLRWERTYDYVTQNSELFPEFDSQDDYCNDITTDQYGLIIVAGASLSPDPNYNTYGNQLLMWDALGNFLSDGPPPSIKDCGPQLPCQSQITKVTLGGNGYVYTIEQHWNTSRNYAKYDADFDLVGGISNLNMANSHKLYDIAADATGNVYLGGYESIPDVDGTTHQYHKLIVLDPDLEGVICEDHQAYVVVPYTQEWLDHIWAVTIGPNGNAYVTGRESQDLIAMEYDATCTPQWTDAAGNPEPLLWNAGANDLGHDVAVDSNHNLILTGTTGYDAVTIKYLYAGTCQPTGPEGTYHDPATCIDQIDNDCDGLIDSDDPQCPQCTPTHNKELGPNLCSDGLDNDCDGNIDCADRDCRKESVCK